MENQDFLYKLEVLAVSILAYYIFVKAKTWLVQWLTPKTKVHNIMKNNGAKQPIKILWSFVAVLGMAVVFWVMSLALADLGPQPVGFQWYRWTLQDDNLSLYFACSMSHNQEATRAFTIGDPIYCGYRYEGNYSNVTIKIFSRTLLPPGNPKNISNLPTEYSISNKFEVFYPLQQQVELQGIYTVADTFRLNIDGQPAKIDAGTPTMSTQFRAYSSYDDLVNRMITLFIAGLVLIATIPQGILALKRLYDGDTKEN